MEIDLVHRYVKNACQTYQACVAMLGLAENRSDLAALLRAARKCKIARRGQITIPGGTIYDYHVHGAGYSFKNLTNGNDIRFDVMEVNGHCHLRFSAWDVYKYASSLGEPIAEETVAAELRRLSAKESNIVHVLDGQFDYYYWTEEIDVETQPLGQPSRAAVCRP